MIYAVVLPTGLVKVGRGSKISRVTAAQVFFAEDVRTAAIWAVDHDARAERLAHAACAPFHVRGELYECDSDTVIALISAALRTPPCATDVPRRHPGPPARGEIPYPWLKRAETAHRINEMRDLNFETYGTTGEPLSIDPIL